MLGRGDSSMADKRLGKTGRISCDSRQLGRSSSSRASTETDAAPELRHQRGPSLELTASGCGGGEAHAASIARSSTSRYFSVACSMSSRSAAAVVQLTLLRTMLGR
jgi:hypothetical protein